MQTSEIVETNFKNELRALFKKYDAEIDVVVEMTEWGAMVDHIEIYIPSSYDIDGELIREESIISLTKWCDWESI